MMTTTFEEGVSPVYMSVGVSDHTRSAIRIFFEPLSGRIWYFFYSGIFQFLVGEPFIFISKFIHFLSLTTFNI
jgi:hypothetical protein